MYIYFYAFVKVLITLLVVLPQNSDGSERNWFGVSVFLTVFYSIELWVVIKYIIFRISYFLGK